jgi:argininosuccinate lyase
LAERDRARLAGCLARIDVMPLGSGALAGTNYPIPREQVAAELGFAAVSANSLDAVGDRDFVIEFAAAASLIMVHLSRLAEELILWSTEEFGFIDLPDAYCTGSSLMPQKKNPDVPELVRGKTGRVFGHLIGLLTMMKALPLAYNRDLQEDKEALFDTVDTLHGCLAMLTGLVAGVSARKDALERAVRSGFLLATELADYLVGKGLPFRQAHEAVGKAVRFCLEAGRSLTQLSLDELRRFSDRFERDAMTGLTLERALARKNVTGGTAPDQVLRRIQELTEQWRRESD